MELEQYLKALDCGPQKEGKEKDTGLGVGLETSKCSSNKATPILTRPYNLNIPKQFH